ncbi:MAG: PIN domain-containing protein [Solirubrobacterales bacterium]
MNGALLDTSIVIASDDEELALPERAAISVITLGELHAGVLLARSGGSRAAREARFRAITEAFDPIPVGSEIAVEFGEALAWTRSQGRSERATDLLIVATARATGRVLHTLDRGQATVAQGLGVEVGG